MTEIQNHDVTVEPGIGAQVRDADGAIWTRLSNGAWSVREMASHYTWAKVLQYAPLALVTPGTSPSTRYSFADATDVDELLGRVIGLCSVTRFWGGMDRDYPSGAGIFQEQEALEIVSAAVDRLMELRAAEFDAVMGKVREVMWGPVNLTTADGAQ